MLRTTSIEWTVVDDDSGLNWESVAFLSTHEDASCYNLEPGQQSLDQELTTTSCNHEEGRRYSEVWQMLPFFIVVTLILIWGSLHLTDHSPEGQQSNVILGDVAETHHPVLDIARTGHSHVLNDNHRAEKQWTEASPSAAAIAISRLNQSYAFSGIDDRTSLQIATSISQLYEDMLYNLGLNIKNAENHLKIQFQLLPLDARWQVQSDEILISPTGLKILTAASIKNRLPEPFIQLSAQHAILELQQSTSPHSEWQIMTVGLNNWLESKFQQTTDIPDDVGTVQHDLGVVQPRQSEQHTLPLIQLRFTEHDWVAPQNEQARVQAAQALIQHIEQCYGLEHVHKTIRKFAETKSWHEIIPDVFGVSILEFEHQWHKGCDVTEWNM